LNKNILKFFSLFFSFLLWIYVLSTLPLEIEKSLEVEVITPKGYKVLSLSETEVNFKFTGPRAFLRNLARSDQKIVMDIRHKFKKKQKSYKLKPNGDMVSVPLGVSTKVLRPEFIEIKIDKYYEKKVPLKMSLVGEVSEGQKILSKKLSKKTITIGGPKSLVDEVSSVPTKPVDLSTLKGEGSLNVFPLMEDSRVVHIDKERDIKLHYQVRPTSANLTLKKLKIRFLSSKKIVSASHRYATLEVLAEEPGRKISKSEVQIVADIPESSSGKVKIALKALLPDDIHLLKVHPEKISVKIK
jgi:YbbR domain-containing protein